jgi:putative SOS response-associated peptidase YedK
VWALPTVAAQADSGGTVRSHFGRYGLESSLQHRSDTVRARRQAKSQERRAANYLKFAGDWFLHERKDSSKAAAMINARSETAATKPAFCDALKFRRCLIPADGFYEWQKVGKAKQPYCFEVNRGELFSFAGLWETWNDPSGKALETCSILTTTANALTAAVHDRMPVILDPRCYDLWLDPGSTDTSVISQFLTPFDAQLMNCFPVD